MRFAPCLLPLLSLCCLPALLRADESKAPTWGKWQKWGDLGDGTYQNPVLPADYSDIDCIRVGDEFYAISSTFQFSPGMVLLRSRDLVNWTTCGHAISDLTLLSPDLNWDRMNRYSRGIWAGALRHQAGRFWIYFGTPDEGYFMTSAPRIEGPWEAPKRLLAEAGWDDCCPFWDDNGQGWLVGTHFSAGYQTWLFRLSPDGHELIREGAVLLHEGSSREANKLYKIQGRYYLLYSEVKPGLGRQLMMRRADKITGPYSAPRTLSHVQREALEPNQGGLLQAPNGSWYFFTHHGTGAWEGRAASLLPVTWLDGWPVLGEPDKSGVGNMVWAGKKPVQGQPHTLPQGSDEFARRTLGPDWEWNYQPRADKWSLSERPGHLRLHAFRGLNGDNLLKVGNILTQRSFRSNSCEVVTCLELAGMAEGQYAGLCHFSAARQKEKPAANSASLGVLQEGARRWLIYSRDGKLTRGRSLSGNKLWLKSSWGLQGKSQFSYSTDGTIFTPFGEPYPLAWAGYRGDRIGLFTYNNQADAGHVDFDRFVYSITKTVPSDQVPARP